MGAYDYKLLADDTIADTVYELADSKELYIDLEKNLDNLIEEQNEDYIDLFECQEALASIILIDISLNDIDKDIIGDYDKDLKKFFDNLKKNNFRNLIDKSLKCLYIIKSDKSEINNLWKENDEDYSKWLNIINLLISRLEKNIKNTLWVKLKKIINN